MSTTGTQATGQESPVRHDRIRDLQVAHDLRGNAACTIERVERAGLSYLTDGAGAESIGQAVMWAMRSGWKVSGSFSPGPETEMLRIEDPDHEGRSS